MEALLPQVLARRCDVQVAGEVDGDAEDELIDFGADGLSVVMSELLKPSRNGECEHLVSS